MVEMISNGTEGVVPATFEIEADITAGTEPTPLAGTLEVVRTAEKVMKKRFCLHLIKLAAIILQLPSLILPVKLRLIL
jgi:hypothetical protein